MNWDTLLNSVRRKSLAGSGETMNTAAGRHELERDYDRILFLAPVRRLADKTQVFPLDANDSVRTRLTHSHEVSNLARSIGVRLAFDFADDVFGSDHEKLAVKRVVPPSLAAVGLVHDLGNPPFGHQGEEAIKSWFKSNDEKLFGGECHDDFLGFDGNAQTFRLLTKLQVLNDDFGLNLTCATLASLIKYPAFSDSESYEGYKKFGVFKSEEKAAKEVWQQTGLEQGKRHPFVYVMEACDDIAYSVLDAEDTIKKGYASFYDLMDYLRSNAGEDAVVLEVVAAAEGKNKEFKEEVLSSSELNDVSMQMFRVKAISIMIESTIETFVSRVTEIVDGKVPPSFELIAETKSSTLCRLLKKFDKRYGFRHKDVLKLELEGANYIKSMLDMLWRAIDGCESSDPFSRYAYGRISENYRRVYEASEMKVYNKCQLLCDAVSGMTDSYLITLHDELRPLCNGFDSN